MAGDSMKVWAEELVDLVTASVHDRIRNYIEGAATPSRTVTRVVGEIPTEVPVPVRVREVRLPHKPRVAKRATAKPKDELNQTATKIIKYLGVGREKTAVELQRGLKLAGGTVRSILPKLVRQGYLQTTGTKPMLYSNKQ